MDKENVVYSPGAVAQAFERQRWENHHSGIQGKKFMSAISTNEWVHWCAPVIPVMWGSTNRWTVVCTSLGKKRVPISKQSTQKGLVK
jgi:hypothetical protein